MTTNIETQLFVMLKALMEVETQLIRCIEQEQLHLEAGKTLHGGTACPIEDRIDVFAEALEALRKHPRWLDDDEALENDP